MSRYAGGSPIWGASPWNIANALAKARRPRRAARTQADQGGFFTRPSGEDFRLTKQCLRGWNPPETALTSVLVIPASTRQSHVVATFLSHDVGALPGAPFARDLSASRRRGRRGGRSEIRITPGR